MAIDEFLGWGLFLSVAFYASLRLLDLQSAAGTALAVVPAAAFFLVWLLGRRSTAAQSAETSVVPAPAAPARPWPASAAQLPSRRALRGNHGQRPTRRRSATAALHEQVPTSRWVREFGPPDTGPLPVQQYRRAQGSGAFAGAVDGRPTGRQWSHSRA